MRRIAVTALALLAACGGDVPSRPPSSPPPTTDARSGGGMTVDDATSKAFSRPGPNLSAERLALHTAGDAVFEATFVPAPAEVNPGLGPRFDNVSCAGCHTGDGRGRPPAAGEAFNSMLFRVSLPGSDAHGGPMPVPGFGTQLALRASVGLTPMAVVTVTYTDSSGTFADGEPYTLRVPHYAITDPYRELPAGVLVSPRVAPPNFGLGLLEAVPDATITALASDPDAVDAGVAGHPNYVWDAAGQHVALGRFGLKANTATLLDQTAAAFNADMGITTSLFPTEPCDDDIPACADHAPDLSDDLLHAVTEYVRTLGVPARRKVDDATVQHGEQLFAGIGCARCHVPTLQTGVVAGAPEVSNQRIHPYTDLLLHDMGPGLADGRPDYLATGREWRTPPLWGIGLTAIVNGHTNFLHDGRARNLTEAILWHGGQGAAAADAFRRLSKSDRQALIAFLNSL
ncbi:MAG: c-type cytochrome [Gemmatimonadaceae bacterium]|nr:c-type cytochrome [Gemmatimonadaceae bacterium]